MVVAPAIFHPPAWSPAPPRATGDRSASAAAASLRDAVLRSRPDGGGNGCRRTPRRPPAPAAGCPPGWPAWGTPPAGAELGLRPPPAPAPRGRGLRRRPALPGAGRDGTRRAGLDRRGCAGGPLRRTRRRRARGRRTAHPPVPRRDGGVAGGTRGRRRRPRGGLPQRPLAL